MNALAELKKKEQHFLKALASGDIDLINRRQSDIENYIRQSIPQNEQLLPALEQSRRRMRVMILERQMDAIEDYALSVQGQRTKLVEIFSQLSNLYFECAEFFFNEKEAIFSEDLVQTQIQQNLLNVETTDATSGAYQAIKSRYDRLTQEGECGEYDARYDDYKEIIKKQAPLKTTLLDKETHFDRMAIYFKFSQDYAHMMRRLQLDNALLILRDIEEHYRNALLSGHDFSVLGQFLEHLQTWSEKINVSPKIRHRLQEEGLLRLKIVQYEASLRLLHQNDVNTPTLLATDARLTQELSNIYEDLANLYSQVAYQGLRRNSYYRAHSTLMKHHSKRSQLNAAESHDEHDALRHTVPAQQAEKFRTLAKEIQEVAEDAQYTMPDKDDFYRRTLKDSIRALNISMRQEKTLAECYEDYRTLARLYYKLTISYEFSSERQHAKAQVAYYKRKLFVNGMRTLSSGNDDLKPVSPRLSDEQLFSLDPGGELITGIIASFGKSFDAGMFLCVLAKYNEQCNAVAGNQDALDMYHILEQSITIIVAQLAHEKILNFFQKLASEDVCHLMNVLCWAASREENARVLLGSNVSEERINTFLVMCDRFNTIALTLQNAVRVRLIQNGELVPKYDKRKDPEVLMNMNVKLKVSSSLKEQLVTILHRFESGELCFIRDLSEQDTATVSGISPFSLH